MAAHETFAALVALCVPHGMAEETWAANRRLVGRSLRRLKAGEWVPRDATLDTLAAKMRELGGTPTERRERILAAIQRSVARGREAAAG